MVNYMIYYCEGNDDDIIVEVFNECDMIEVQKEILERGYYIFSTISPSHFKALKCNKEV